MHLAPAFEDRLDQVQLAHGHPTRSDHRITGGQALLDFVGEFVLSVTANAQRYWLGASPLHRSHEGIAVAVADLARTRLGVWFNDFVTCREDSHAGAGISDERGVSHAGQQADFLW